MELRDIAAKRKLNPYGFSDSVVDSSLLDVGTIAELLGCSARHVFRLRDAGRMPASINVGRLVRWRAADIETWIAEGCPSEKGGRR